jgi:CRISPR-associated endonuclease Csn1
MRLAYANSAGTLAFADHNEANVDKRTRAKELSYVFKTAGSLQKANARHVTISPIGEVSDPGFKG